jgi:hypothetical protein
MHTGAVSSSGSHAPLRQILDFTCFQFIGNITRSELLVTWSVYLSLFVRSPSVSTEAEPFYLPASNVPAPPSILHVCTSVPFLPLLPGEPVPRPLSPGRERSWPLEAGLSQPQPPASPSPEQGSVSRSGRAGCRLRGVTRAHPPRPFLRPHKPPRRRPPTPRSSPDPIKLLHSHPRDRKQPCWRPRVPTRSSCPAPTSSRPARARGADASDRRRRSAPPLRRGYCRSHTRPRGYFRSSAHSA